MDFVFLLGAGLLWAITALLVVGFGLLDQPVRTVGGKAPGFVSPGLRPPPFTSAERSATHTPKGQP